MNLDFLEIFTLVTGVLFLIFEIRQSNWMWFFSLLSSAAAIVSFTRGGLYASAGLNVYYVVMAAVGAVQWRIDAYKAATRAAFNGAAMKASENGTAVENEAASENEASGKIQAPSSQDSAPGKKTAGDSMNGDVLHLRHPSLKVWLVSALIMVAGTTGLYFLLSALADPMSVTDASVTVLSGIATWWLAKSYPQQWLLWVVADAASVVLCGVQGMIPMAILYAVYAVSAVYGYIHWMRKGVYVD